MESWLAERAKEELEILQTKHPGSRFDYLKFELKALISESHDHCESFPSCNGEEAACTQASSNLKRKAVVAVDMRDVGSVRKRAWREDRVDMVIKRALACLDKIHQLKQNLISLSTENDLEEHLF
ncbi:Mur ligase central domain-containing protein [Dioscorea alata]|uniref:Mur ligase central domain-containing protein n=1 Tax=Dioscorea alata TaxID=55571 RepID=A0ACB7WPG5_DIOAL|nr:Mur ligase central domain-containing protein [Dioscorea alata]